MLCYECTGVYMYFSMSTVSTSKGRTLLSSQMENLFSSTDTYKDPYRHINDIPQCMLLPIICFHPSIFVALKGLKRSKVMFQWNSSKSNSLPIKEALKSQIHNMAAL